MANIKPIKNFLENVSSSFFNVFPIFLKKKAIYKSNELIFQNHFDDFVLNPGKKWIAGFVKDELDAKLFN